MGFYVLLGKTKAGPYSVESLKTRGYWNSDTLVCKEGEQEWKHIGEMSEEEFIEAPVEEVWQRPDPPEELSREAIACLTLIFPLLILATIYEEKAAYHYRMGNNKLVEKYNHNVHTCVVVAVSLVCLGFVILLFLYKSKTM